VDAESKEVIDASGAFADGRKFTGPVEFRTGLMQMRVEFIETVAEKLLTYGLGRGAETYDRPALRRILREAAGRDYRWSAVILGIVKSEPFQMRMAASAVASQQAAN
jgi:hypothetical protein